MTIRFVEEAQREFLDAISRYEEARAGLGQRFKDEVDRSILWVALIGNFTACDRAHIAASTFGYSPITLLPLPESKLSGSWL